MTKNLSPFPIRLRHSWVLLAATAILFISCTKRKIPELPPLAVQVTKVVEQDVPLTNTWIGNFAPLVNAQIRAQVSGYLLEQKYKDGQTVKKGDVLFQIDPRPFQAALDQAKGTFDQAQANYTKAALNAQRSQELYKTKVISQQQYDDEVQAYQAAKAQADAAKAGVDQAQINLSFCQIASPIDGLAAISQAQIGDLVSPSSGVLTTVVTVDPLKINFTVSEQNYLRMIKPFLDDPKASREEKVRNISFHIYLSDGTLYPEAGTFYAANNQVGENTGALQIEGRVANPANLLRPGQFARVKAIVHIEKGALLVPARAVMDTQGISQLAVVGADNKISIRTVTTGENAGNWTIIKEGIKDGETVVVEGLQKVRDGMVVDPKPYVITEPPPSFTPESKPSPEPSPAADASPSPSPAASVAPAAASASPTP